MTQGKKKTGAGDALDRIRTGIDGLDEILRGGFIQGRSYLVRGGPGGGKTILGYHFLVQGTQKGEHGLLVQLEESALDLQQNARSLGMDLTDVEILDLSPAPDEFGEAAYDLFEPDEVETGAVSERIAEAIEEHEPDRVVVDPASQLRHLAPDVYRFRKQIVALKRQVAEYDGTLLLTSQTDADDADEALQFATDGTVDLFTEAGDRKVRVPKFRGSGSASGTHDVRIDGEGMHVYPIVVPTEHRQPFDPEPIPSGVEGLDEQLHGGIERGTVTVISGPTGAGKTTTGTHFIKEAAARGERSAIYLLEETSDTFTIRSEAVGCPITEMIEEGTLRLEEVEPLMRSADEFANRVRQEVEEEGVRIVMIDALAGYRLSLRSRQEEIVQKLHGLCRYLRNMGVTTILVDETRGDLSSFQPTDAQISNIADNILFLRHLEIDGELRKIVGVLKKRVSDFQSALRELRITEDGLVVGDKLEGLQGVLRGAPVPVQGVGPTG